jgi:hypothetical protein
MLWDEVEEYRRLHDDEAEQLSFTTARRAIERSRTAAAATQQETASQTAARKAKELEFAAQVAKWKARSSAA